MKHFSLVSSAWALIIWSVVSIALVLISAPVWLRLPIVGLFALLAVGFATVLVLEIRQVPLAIGIVIASGLASLILASEVVLYAGTWSPLRALVLQALLVISLCSYVAIRENREVQE